MNSPIRHLTLTLLLVVLASSVHAAPVAVSNGSDSDRGSFRAAVDAANADSSIHRIVFTPGLTVLLDGDVVYTGSQRLTIDGNSSAVVPSAAFAPADTWDGGLFVSTGGADMTLTDIGFYESPNNGVGVFLPEDAKGKIRIALHNVVIEASRFHGLYVDGQFAEEYDTDGVVHPDCKDPWPYDSDAGIVLDVRRVDILSNGTLAGGYDTGTPIEGGDGLTGCPADFDGVRADDGGKGGIEAGFDDVWIDGNLADGAELDERGPGNVRAIVRNTKITRNGETGTDDLDDGFDIDESDEGSLTAVFEDCQVSENRDEGLDLDEAGEGSARVVVRRCEANGNEDQGVKIDEEDAGRLTAYIVDSVVNDSLSQHGIEFTEEDGGGLRATVRDTEVTGNDDAAIAGEQEEPGKGRLRVIGSDLTGNGDPSFELAGIELTVEDTSFDE